MIERARFCDRKAVSYNKWNKDLKPDRDTNLNDPSAKGGRSDCNLRLFLAQKIKFRIANAGYERNLLVVF